MIEKPDQVKNIFLFSGDIYFGNQTGKISTILGSCISVIMYNRNNRIFGITHSTIPNCMNKICKNRSCTDYAKSTVCSIEKLFKLFHSKNVPRDQIEISIFGGSELIIAEDSKINIGRKNIEAAFSTIKSKNLIIKHENVGGNVFREIQFSTSSGEIFLKKTKYTFLTNE